MQAILFHKMFNNKANIFSKNSWFIKYKLYHIPFWFLYHIAWWTLTIRNFSAVANNLLSSAYSIKFLFYVVFQAIAVYFNLFYLIPHYLQKGKYGLYILFLLLVVLSTSWFIVAGYYTSAYLSDFTFKELYQREPSDFMFFFLINALPSTMASTTLAMSIKLTKNWIQSERKQHVLEKEKLETELKYLKSQFNPHFLFNTINSIFVLIHKNPDLASESLASFSDLLRYQLYECNENEIALEKELFFLNNFIELERLRLDEKQTDLKFEINNHSAIGQTIEPFILMPFVENAFKHVSKGKGQQNYISMTLDIDSEMVHLMIENSFVVAQKSDNGMYENSGIGLKNVIRRLDLLYPEHYKLAINETTDRYKVALKLALNKKHSLIPQTTL